MIKTSSTVLWLHCRTEVDRWECCGSECSRTGSVKTVRECLCVWPRGGRRQRSVQTSVSPSQHPFSLAAHLETETEKKKRRGQTSRHDSHHSTSTTSELKLKEQSTQNYKPSHPLLPDLKQPENHQLDDSRRLISFTFRMILSECDNDTLLTHVCVLDSHHSDFIYLWSQTTMSDRIPVQLFVSRC